MGAGLSIPKLRGVVMELAGDDGDITFPTSGQMATDGLVVMDQMKALAGKTSVLHENQDSSIENQDSSTENQDSSIEDEDSER